MFDLQLIDKRISIPNTNFRLRKKKVMGNKNQLCGTRRRLYELDLFSLSEVQRNDMNFNKQNQYHIKPVNNFSKKKIP